MIFYEIENNLVGASIVFVFSSSESSHMHHGISWYKYRYGTEQTHQLINLVLQFCNLALLFSNHTLSFFYHPFHFLDIRLAACRSRASDKSNNEGRVHVHSRRLKSKISAKHTQPHFFLNEGKASLVTGVVLHCSAIRHAKCGTRLASMYKAELFCKK